MRMSSGRGYGGSVSAGGGMPEASGGIFSFLSAYPAWVTNLLIILGVVILAWIAGIIAGKIYSSIKYPDPNKATIFSPKQKLIFLGVAATVIAMLYVTLNKPVKPIDDFATPDSGISTDGESGENNPDKGLDIDLDAEKNRGIDEAPATPAPEVKVEKAIIAG